MSLACWQYSVVPEVHLPKSDAAASVSQPVQRLGLGSSREECQLGSDQLAPPNK